MKNTDCKCDEPTFEKFLTFVKSCDLGINKLTDQNSFQYRILLANYKFALHAVPCALLQIDLYLYEQVIYNYALHVYITLCFDSGFDNFIDQEKLKKMGILSNSNWRNGVIQSTYDNGTGVSFVTPDFYKNMSLNDFDLLRTPFGRFVEGILQQLGSVWGLTRSC
ncbi:hypothetical protein [Commensalibacter communis]|nr:hypothetical protein [Commensalibacter communis]